MQAAGARNEARLNAAQLPSEHLHGLHPYERADVEWLLQHSDAAGSTADEADLFNAATGYPLSQDEAAGAAVAAVQRQVRLDRVTCRQADGTHLSKLFSLGIQPLPIRIHYTEIYA